MSFRSINECVQDCSVEGRHLSLMFPDFSSVQAVDGTHYEVMSVRCAHCRTDVDFTEALEQVELPSLAIIGTTTQQFNFLSALRDENDSINSYLSKLPRRRFSHESKGLLLLSPRTGLGFVPHTLCSDGSWYVVVIRGDDTYRVGGYDLIVCALEIETSLRLDVVV